MYQVTESESVKWHSQEQVSVRLYVTLYECIRIRKWVRGNIFPHSGVLRNVCGEIVAV